MAAPVSPRMADSSTGHDDSEPGAQVSTPILKKTRQERGTEIKKYLAGVTRKKKSVWLDVRRQEIGRPLRRWRRWGHRLGVRASSPNEENRFSKWARDKGASFAGPTETRWGRPLN